MEKFMSDAYQKQKPFAGFLPGIAGQEGLPMWVFYVNRGQVISSFGVRDKNGSITEFYPANLAYAYVHQHGFRTFIKYQNQVKECFLESSSSQTLTVEAHQIIIEEIISQWQIKVKVTYATLPNTMMSALMRKVELINLDNQTKEIQLVDGLSQMLPAGIDYGGYKAISNLLQSWMEVEDHRDYVFLKLRSSTADSSEVQMVTSGHFYRYTGLENPHYIYDYKAVFGLDSSLTTPYPFQTLSFQDFLLQKQAPVNQVPSAFVSASVRLEQSKTIIGLFGFSQDQYQLKSMLDALTLKVLEEKFNDNQRLIKTLTQEIQTTTRQPMFDAYLQQCYLDNILRGGYPIIFDTKVGKLAYHIYSRKHGDLERDYNFFTLEPSFYSQGNGAFRDVLQNRRNDLYFHPEVDATTIGQFASLLQADGYNPLSIEGIHFTFQGKVSDYPISVQAVLNQAFTPGQLALALRREGLDVQSKLEKIIHQSLPEFKATYGEGYWGDHFTYFVDLLEAYADIYPDRIPQMMMRMFPYFVSPVRVKPRKEKYRLVNGKVRQYQAIDHDHHLPPRGWLKDQGGQILQSSLFAKLLTLITNKFSLLDPDELGLMYEADRPGWNDAMNGLPGLLGSGTAELIELLRLVKFVQPLSPSQSVDVIAPLIPLMKALMQIDPLPGFQAWNQRMNALETYREQLLKPLQTSLVDATLIERFLSFITQRLSQAVHHLQDLYSVPPTYFTYEVTSFAKIEPTSASNPVFVHAQAFKRFEIPAFLEGPARMFSARALPKEKGKKLYQTIRQSELYDAKLKIYKTSLPLEKESMEIGRIRAFTPGWLERESAFLHMTYKYLYGLLRSEFYPEFFSEIQTGMTCFMDPKVYGRSPLENSSFIATSNNPDSSKHGQGFFARLSGSTAEVISMWKYMMFGSHLFTVHDGELRFQIRPILTANFFQNGLLETTLFSRIRVVLHYDGQTPTYDASIQVSHYELWEKGNPKPLRVEGLFVQGSMAQSIRALHFETIHVYLKGGSPRPL